MIFSYMEDEKVILKLKFTHAISHGISFLQMPLGHVSIRRHLTRLPRRECIPVAGTFPFTLSESEDAQHASRAREIGARSVWPAARAGIKSL